MSNYVCWEINFNDDRFTHHRMCPSGYEGDTRRVGPYRPLPGYGSFSHVLRLGQDIFSLTEPKDIARCVPLFVILFNKSFYRFLTAIDDDDDIGISHLCPIIEGCSR